MGPINVIEFLLSTFLFMGMLCLIGYGSIRFMEIIFRKKLMHFANQFFGVSSDNIMKLNLFLYIGMSFILLYAEIFLSLKVFNFYTLSGLSVLSGIILLYDIFKNKATVNFFKDKLIIRRFTAYLSPIAIVISLGLIAILRSTIIVGEFGSPSGDAAIHSIVILRIIKSNVFTPEFIYQSGGHVIASFFTLNLNIPIYKTVILLTGAFSVLVFLGFYCLGVSYFKKPTYGYLCAFLATLFWFGTYSPIYWGDLPFMMGIYVAVSALAFSINFAAPIHEHLSYRVLFTVLLLIPLFAIYVVSLFYVMFWLLLLFARSLISHHEYFARLKTWGFLILSFAMAAFLAAFYFMLPLTAYAYPALSGSLSASSGVLSRGWWDDHLISPIFFLQIPTFYTQLSETRNVLGVSSFSLIPYGVLACIILIFLMFAQKYKFRDRMQAVNRYLSSLSYVSKTMLMLYGFYVLIYLYLTYIWTFRGILPTERIYQYLGIIFTMLEFLSIIVFWLLLTNSLHGIKIRISYFKRSFHVSRVRVLSMLRGKTKTIAALIILSLIFLSTINVVEPFSKTSETKSWLNEFNVLTDDDINLQLWMKQNLNDSSIILVSWGDAGQYVPIIADKKAVFEFVNVLDSCPLTREYAQQYRKLLQLLDVSPDNPVTLKLLQFFNITYIYVGAKESTRFGDTSPSKVNFPEYTVLNASLLNSAGHYKLTYRVGRAQLFEVVYNAPVTIQISTCDTTEDWFTFESDIATSAKIMVSTTTYIEGQGSIEWTFKFNRSSSYTDLILNPAGGWNFTDKEFIEFWVYGNNSKASYAVYLFDQLNRARYVMFVDNFDGWQRFAFPLSKGGASGDPNMDLNVERLMFRVFCNPNLVDNNWRHLYVDDIWVKG